MTRFHFTRRAAITGLGALAVAGGLGFGTTRYLQEREAARQLARVPSPSLAWTDRVRELHERLAGGDFAAAAESAGYLSDEAFSRADRVVEWWLAQRVHFRGLLPKSPKSSRRALWNYRDCAADMYCHFVIEASLIGRRHLGALREILATERALSADLPHAIYLDTGEPLDDPLDERIFGAVEYAKDGLLPILERVGPSEWLDRMHEVVNAIIDASPVESRYGRLPSEGTEKNGEFLQVLARLYHRERDPRYLVAGRAIADAYTQEVLPYGDGLPSMTWDFTAGKPRSGTFRVRDHGNEIVSGLGEWIMAESVTEQSQAEKYRPAVEHMMDMLLDHARDTSGLWDSNIRTWLPPRTPPAQPVNDNWGYLTAGYVGYALSLPEDSPRRQRYLAESTRALASVIHYRGAAWERGQMDGYADTIEGANYVLPYLNVDGAARWIDDQTGILMAYQKPDGFVGPSYLDGNFVRTSLAYAFFRTQGARPDPWLPGLRLGAVKSPEGLNVSVACDRPWSGRIVFDRNRHHDHLGLEKEYPRLNGWTEWFTAEADRQYDVTLTRAGGASETTIVGGDVLRDGLPVAISSGPTALKIVRRG
jgi:hypothetical protein